MLILVASTVVLGQAASRLAPYSVAEVKWALVVTGPYGRVARKIGPPAVEARLGHTLAAGDGTLQLLNKGHLRAQWAHGEINKMLLARPETRAKDSAMISVTQSPWVLRASSITATRAGWLVILGMDSRTAPAGPSQMRFLAQVDAKRGNLSILRKLEAVEHAGRDNLQRLLGKLYLLDGYRTSTLKELDESGNEKRVVLSWPTRGYDPPLVLHALDKRWLIIKKPSGGGTVFDAKSGAWSVPYTPENRKYSSALGLEAFDDKTKEACFYDWNDQGRPMTLANLATRKVRYVLFPHPQKVFALMHGLLFADVNDDAGRKVYVYDSRSGKLVGTLPIKKMPLWTR